MYEIFNLFCHVPELCILCIAPPQDRLGIHRRERAIIRDITACFRQEEALVDSVRPSLTLNPRMGALRNGTIEPEVRVAVVVRILSVASYLDMMFIWHIGHVYYYPNNFQSLAPARNHYMDLSML